MDGKFKIFVIVAIVVLAASIAGSTFFVMKAMGNNNTPQEADTQVAEEKPVKLAEVALGEAIMTNISMESNNVQHFAKVQISIGIDATDEKAVEAFKADIEAKSASIRSEIIDTIGEQTFSMLSNPTTGKEKLGDELIPRLNQLLDTEMIKEIYYQEYFVQ